MSKDNYLNEKEISKAKHDDWYWMYFLGLYDTLAITYPILVYQDIT